MLQKISCDSHLSMRKRYRLLLAFCWVSGFVCGIAVYAYGFLSFSNIIRRAVMSDTSALTLISSELLILLLSGAALFYSVPAMLFVICFGSAFLFGLVSVGVVHVFGCAGWLVRLLFLFCDAAAMPVLYLYWLRCLRWMGTGHSGCIRFLLALCMLLGIRCADNCIITPFLARLIDF